MKIKFLLPLIVLGIMLSSCKKDMKIQPPAPVSQKADSMFVLVIQGDTFNATMSDNATAEAFAEMRPLTLTMSDLNANEKYHYIDQQLPSKPVAVKTIQTGDIMLYGTSCIVLFYKDLTTPYEYTKIGHITNTAHLMEAVGAGNVEVAFDVTTKEEE